MLLALHPVDFAVVALLLGTLVAIGIAVRRPRRAISEFLLANKGLSALPVGLSLTAALLPAIGVVGSMLAGLSLIGLPGQAYDVGLKPLWILPAMWLAVPLMWRYVLPLYHGLGLTSVYAYLELRFDRRTRTLASMVFLAWRVLWIAGVLAFGCQILVAATGMRIPSWLLIILLGTISTSYSYLGGIKAVVWADAFQLAVMGSTAVVLVFSIWMALDDGVGRVWSVAESLERSQILSSTSDVSGPWSQWGFVAYAACSLLALFVVDQATVQRLLAVRDAKVARQAFMTGCTSLTIAVLTLTYLGLGFLAFYHDHSESLRAKWVTNVDPATRQALVPGELSTGEGGRRALDWDDPDSRVDAANIQSLVDQRRIIRPNSRDAIEDAGALLDPNSPEGLEVRQLLTRYPPKADLRRGEVVLHARANDELLPWYIATQLPWGLCGLAIAAIFAAIMSSLSSGLLALSGIVATHVGVAVDDDANAESSDLVARIAVLVMGVAMMIGALLMVVATDRVRVVLIVTGTLGGPLLAVFLLGIFTKRTTSIGAMIGLTIGMVLTGWLTCANTIASFAWPFSQPIGASWAFSLGVVLTAISGYVASRCVGARTPADELRGLVWGHGRLGERDEEVVPRIKLPKSNRWK